MDAILNGRSRDQAKAAFDAITPILHRLRPKLRAAVAHEFLSHPAYANDGFPIHWQGQSGFLEAPRPPAYVRFSHHPSERSSAPQGHSMISCFSRGPETYVEAIRDVILAAYSIGPVGDVLIENVDHKPGFESRGVYHLPIHLDWRT